MERVHNKKRVDYTRFMVTVLGVTCCMHTAHIHASQENFTEKQRVMHAVGIHHTSQAQFTEDQCAIEAAILAANSARNDRRASNIQQWHQTVAPQREAELAQQRQEFTAQQRELMQNIAAETRQTIEAARARLALAQAQQREIVAQAAAPASANPEIPSYSGKPVVSRIRLRFVPPGSPESSYWPALAAAPVLEDQPVGPESEQPAS